MASLAGASPSACPECRTELATDVLICPTCHRLVHAETLKRVAEQAAAADAGGDAARALALWQQAVTLLPPGSRQHAAVSEKVSRLLAQAGPDATAARPSWARRAGPIGVLGLLAWKFKSVAAFVLSKGTLLTMLLSLGVYWTAWGWRFAAGLVASIYLHEIGHVVSLRARGFKASAPMFVPGLGAFVSHPPIADPGQQARVSLAGPIWGLGSALLALAAFAGSAAPFLAGTAVWAARINLLNLVPLPPLDGASVFRALSGAQRFGLLLVGAAALYYTREGMLWLVVPVMALRTLTERPPGAEAADWPLFAQAAFVLLALAVLAAVPVPGVAAP